MRGLDCPVVGALSPLARIDPLVKLCATLLTILAVSTLPSDAGWRYAAVLAALLGLWGIVRLPARYLLRRLMAATPFIAMAAAMPLVSTVADGALLALAVLCKAYSAILLLSMLTASTPIEEIVQSLRRLGAPRSLALVAILMHRYLFVLLEEWRRVARARECRTGGRLATGRARLWANQAAMVFVRGWERADRVAQAMAARGFRGDLRRLRRPRPGPRDLALGLVLPLAVLALRIA